MYQMKILLAQELRFRRSCSASGSRAPSSVIGRARPCSLCPSSPSPTPAPHTGPFPPGSAWPPPAMRAPSPHRAPLSHPLHLPGLVGGSLLLPKILLGSRTETQRDLRPVFGFTSNIPTTDTASRLFLCRHVPFRGRGGEGDAIPRRRETGALLRSMSPSTSPTDPFNG